jgi:hypothetical protein
MEYAYTPEGSERQVTTDLLSGVEKVYGHVIDCLAEMREVTDGPVPEPFRYTRARYRISNASLKRRQLFDSICTRLCPLLPLPDAAPLRALREKDREYLRHSANYVTKWTPTAVFDDWQSYSKEAKGIQRHLQQVVEEQLRVLTPLLIRCGYAGRRSCHLKPANGRAR